MKNQRRILVFTIIVACISLALSLPRIVNADDAVYQVMEFVGSSYLSYEDATQNALKAEPSFSGLEGYEGDFFDFSLENEYERQVIVIKNESKINEGSDTQFVVRLVYILMHWTSMYPPDESWAFERGTD